MSDISTIRNKVRNLLGDVSKRGTDPFVYGNSPVFTLTENNIDDIISVYHNDTELDSGEFSFDTTTNKLTLYNSGNTSGDIIEVIYNYCPNYSNNEIDSYIRAAISHLAVSSEMIWIEDSEMLYPPPIVKETNLISLVTSILIDPKNVSYRLPDISVIIPTGGAKGTSTAEQVRRLISYYKKDSEAGAGVWGII